MEHPIRNRRRQFLKTALAVTLPSLAAQPPREKPVAGARNRFRLRIAANLKPFDAYAPILDIPGVLTVRLRRHDPSDRARQNYPAFPMPDGSVPVLEAELKLHSDEHPDWRSMTVGVPLAMLKKPWGAHDIVLDFSAVRWTLYVDGELVDNDFPFGYPDPFQPGAWTANAALVTRAALEASQPPPTHTDRPLAAPVQYWTPPGHNSWVGDVVTLVHRGRYHVFYLYDRRHHQSKFGKGAHYFEHLSTTDLIHWTEHSAATPLDEQWECIGTGTPFVFRDKLYLSYGLHTGRICPDAKTSWPAQWAYLKAHGRTGSFGPDAPGAPAGATYSISADGVSNFKKSGIVFHPCQNPGVYIAPGGQLRMLANAGSNGIWEAESPEGGWRQTLPGFPPGGDCTFFFRWGQHDYIIGGFRGLWSKPADAPDTAYQDQVAKGLDFYDGSNVPAVSRLDNGRYAMAAWIPIRGWGGPLVIRELLQQPDGRIGSRWMPEVTPQFDAPKPIPSNRPVPAPGRSFLLEMTVDPARSGRFAIDFLPAEGSAGACQWSIDPHSARAQFGPASPAAFGPAEKSLREGGAPEKVLDYAIENLLDVGRPFPVRVIVASSDKLGGSLIDAEIAGKRTMISYRPDLAVGRLAFRSEGAPLAQLRIATLKRNPRI